MIVWNENVTEETKQRVLRKRFPTTNPFKGKNKCLYGGVSLNGGTAEGPVGPIYLLKTQKGEQPNKGKVALGGDTRMSWSCGCKTSYTYSHCKLGHSAEGEFHWIERLDESCSIVHSRAYDSKWEEIDMKQILEQLNTLALEILDLAEAEASITEAKKDHIRVAEQLMSEHNIKTTDIDLVKLTRYDAGSKNKLNKTKLLEFVDAIDLATCYSKGSPSYTVKVTQLKKPANSITHSEGVDDAE